MSEINPPATATLRSDFVTMLFALAAGQVAVFSYQVFSAVTPAVGTSSDLDLWVYAAFAHLAVALLVIASSWVGWSKSMSASREVQRVFDKDFLPWVLDVFLVIVYFFLASSAEVKGPLAPDGTYELTRPSALPETKFVLYLLLLYFVWDLLSKCWPAKFPAKFNEVSSINISKWCKNAVASSLASVISSILAIVFFVVVTKQVETNTITPSAYAVISVDIAIGFLVVLFRVLKSLERHCQKLQEWRTIPSTVPTEPYWEQKVFYLSLGFVAFAVLSCVV